MPDKIELFSTSICPRCMKVAKLLDSIGIEYTKRVIDKDPEAETDAMMFNIFSAPALKKGNELLRSKDIFEKDEMIEDKIKEFVGA
ncbi:MAG: glutaredoxin family protein [Promethearchaeota archaeon]